MKTAKQHSISIITACGVLLACGILLSACGDSINHAPPPVSNNTTHEYSELERRFLDDAVELQLREELDVEVVTTQYVLIANGIESTGKTKPELSLGEALTKAAEVYKRAKEGADFDKLVYAESYGRLEKGQRPGTYTWYRTELPPGLGPVTFLRTQEEPAVWKAAWRLQPGEIGVVERHEKDANTGYHIIRRLTDDEVKRDNPANFPTANAEVQAMRDAAQDLLARDEHDTARVKLQHILIPRYMSDPKGTKKILKPQEAEELAAKVFAQASAEPDKFSDLVREYTYDSTEGDPPGSYKLVADAADANSLQYARKDMIPWYGDAGWRLKVGEVGIILYDSAKSWYGYHIIKRIE